MCTYQTLYYSPEGYVIYCKECRNFQVAFSCLYLKFNEEDFIFFKNMISDLFTKTDFTDQNHLRDILIRTPAEGISFAFSKYELEKFNHILESADSEYQTLALMRLFNP